MAAPITSKSSSSLLTSAAHAYETFTDEPTLARWLPFAQRACVFADDDHGRVTGLAIVRQLADGWLAYTLQYSYDPSRYAIWWRSETPGVELSGEACFVPLWNRKSVLTYSVTIDLPVIDEALADELALDPASRVVDEFREYLRCATVVGSQRPPVQRSRRRIRRAPRDQRGTMVR